MEKFEKVHESIRARELKAMANQLSGQAKPVDSVLFRMKSAPSVLLTGIEREVIEGAVFTYWPNRPAEHPGVQIGRDDEGRWHTYDMEGNLLAVSEPDDD